MTTRAGATLILPWNPEEVMDATDGTSAPVTW